MDFTSLNIGYQVPLQAPSAGNHPRVELAELGATGTPIFGGFLREQGEYNPDLTGLSAYRIYEQMRRGDGQVKATLAAVKLPIRAAQWQVLPPDAATPVEIEAADHVRSCLLDELDFDGILENALLMLDFGAAVHEDVYYLDGDRVRLKKCAARLPLTFNRWLTAENGDDLVALEQMGYRGGNYVTTQVPANKLSLFTFQQEGANFSGLALLRSMYPHWYIKSNLYKVEAIACERNGMGVPWIEMGPNAKVEDRKEAYRWLQSLSVNESTSILMPVGWKFGLEGVKGQIQSPKDAIAHHNWMISQAALASFLNFGQGDSSGNRSLGQTMNDFFAQSLQATANSIGRVIAMTTAKRLCDLNFGVLGRGRYPRIVPQQVTGVKLETVVAALKELASGAVGVIRPDEDLEADLRQKLGMPVASKTPRLQRVDAAGSAGPSGTSGEAKDVVMSARAGGFTPARALRGAETFMALSAISSRLDAGRDEIAGALRAAKPHLQAEIVQKLMARPLREAHRVSVGLDASLVAKVEPVIEEVAAFGVRTVSDERRKQGQGIAPETVGTLVGAAVKRDPLGVYADGVVSEFTNNLQQRATNVVLDMRRKDWPVGKQITSALELLDGQADGWIDAVASKGANEGFASGRSDGFAQYAEEIAEFEYSAILDGNTCAQCSSADGERGEAEDDITPVPNPDCEGGDKCRCVHIAVFRAEGKAA